MADILFPIIPPQVHKRKFRLHEICLEDYSDEKLPCRYQFGRDSLEFLTEILQNDLQHEKKPGAVADSTDPRSVAFFRQW